MTVWLDGAIVPRERAALSIDDPGVRWGEGLFETMRARDGAVPLIERHLDRLERSAEELGLAPMPERERVRSAVAEALAAAGGGDRRVRVTATPRPTLLVEVTREDAVPVSELVARAISVRGAWSPSNVVARSKSLSYEGPRRAQRLAEAAGTHHALLLDADGRLGEAALCSAFAVIDGTLVTAPADGLLPGIARGLVMDALPVRERAAREAQWRGASEIILTNAVAGATAVVEVDGVPVGDRRPGPWSYEVGEVLRAALGGDLP
ncbi:MAG: aminotransferase class IV [Thermoleophilia bacterium]